MNKIIDLRSDTVTKPTEEMRKAMSSAIVGDDVYKDDPTVNELEKYAAIVMGKQSAIFVPSGTMGNQICIKTHTNPGEEIILHRKSHIFVYELGAPAIISGVLTKLLDGKDGAIDIKELISGIQEGDMHHAKTTLICMENTHNVCGGTIVSVEHMKKVYDIAKENNIKVHLDGARIFNAAAALGVDACEIAKYCDSVMFCLSKGLGAPVGSMICGDVDFIEKAMRVRKMLGGTMRQAGIIASAGLLALKTMPDKLCLDHEKALFFAEGLMGHRNVDIDIPSVQTNMVNVDFINTAFDSYDISIMLKDKNILVNGDKNINRMRFVFHRDVDMKDTQIAIEALKQILN